MMVSLKSWLVNPFAGMQLASSVPVMVPVSTPAPVMVPVATPAPVMVPVATPAPVVVPVATPAPVVVPVATPAPVVVPVATPAPVVVPVATPAPVVVPVATPAPVVVPVATPAPVATTPPTLSPTMAANVTSAEAILIKDLEDANKAVVLAEAAVAASKFMVEVTKSAVADTKKDAKTKQEESDDDPTSQDKQAASDAADTRVINSLTAQNAAKISLRENKEVLVQAKKDQTYADKNLKELRALKG